MLYVSEPRKNGKGYKRPEKLAGVYQEGGVLFEIGDITNLVDQFPEAFYFTDDPDTDFGPIMIDLDDYALHAEGDHFVFVYRPTHEVLITTMSVSLETLTWRAQQHHLGVKDPKR